MQKAIKKLIESNKNYINIIYEAVLKKKKFRSSVKKKLIIKLKIIYLK